LARVGDGDVLGWLARLATVRFNLLHDVHSLDDSSEHDVTVVQPGRLDSGDEELRSVCVGASVRHRHDARPGVLQGEILVLEFVAIDGFSSGAVVIREIAALTHEVGDNAMECRALVAVTLLAGAQRTEVLARFRNYIGTKLDDDATDRGSIGSHIKKDARQTHFTCKIPHKTSIVTLFDVQRSKS